MAQSTKLAGGAPVAAATLVSADQVTILGSGTALDPLRAVGGGGSFEASVAAALTIGMAVGVRFSVEVRPAGPASGNAANQVWGVSLETNSTIGSPVRIQNTGVVTLTTAQWDAVTGDSGGLTKGALYYVSQSTPGHLTTTTPTTGQHSNVVGVGIQNTDLLLIPSPTSIAP